MQDLPADSAQIKYLSPVQGAFEKTYLQIRAMEKRLYTVEQVRSLPYPSDPLLRGHGWEMRSRTAEKVVRYFSSGNVPLRVLDIGCGNGWFCNLMAGSPQVISVVGMDINEHELKQAAEAFGENPKLQWVYADLFSASLSMHRFDRITLNTSVQYFPDFSILVARVRDLLVPGGEIHILDSPFFRTPEAQEKSRAKSLAYYTSLGHPGMSKDFTPHLWSEVDQYEHRILYRPSWFSSLLRRLKLGSLVPHSNPYRWICIR